MQVPPATGINFIQPGTHAMHFSNFSHYNKNTFAFGNDFAIDDITFSPVYIKRYIIRITVNTPSINTNSDLTVCAGTQTQLATNGAATYSCLPEVH